MISKSDIVFALVRCQHDILLHCCYCAASLIIKSIFLTWYYFLCKNCVIKVEITKFQNFTSVINGN